ncbi:MAG TPA: WYL domain-containing protein [Acidimicrobiales bacterium]|nr:WYL domain-containing protein [Acidimicrobiales bacterium]
MSRRIPATERLARLLALVPWVAGQPDGVPVDQVCERFDVDRDELVRDLETVMMVGVHPYTPDTMIEAWIDDDRVMIHYADAFSRPLRLTADEAVTMIAAARGLAAVPGGDRNGPLQRAITKLSAVVGPDADTAIDVDLGDASREVFERLDTARADQLQVEITYPDAADGQPHTRRIEPSQLFSSSGNWYVSGWCHRADDNRVFRVDRIIAAHPTEETFTHRDQSAPNSVFFDASFPQIELEVDRSVAWILDQVPVISREDGDATVRFRLAIGSPRWLARLLVRLGPSVRIVDADPSLDAGRLTGEEATRIRARYR